MKIIIDKFVNEITKTIVLFELEALFFLKIL